jgi:hypothetical protein
MRDCFARSKNYSRLTIIYYLYIRYMHLIRYREQQSLKKTEEGFGKNGKKVRNLSYLKYPGI